MPTQQVSLPFLRASGTGGTHAAASGASCRAGAEPGSAGVKPLQLRGSCRNEQVAKDSQNPSSDENIKNNLEELFKSASAGAKHSPAAGPRCQLCPEHVPDLLSGTWAEEIKRICCGLNPGEVGTPGNGRAAPFLLSWGAGGMCCDTLEVDLQIKTSVRVCQTRWPRRKARCRT